jgi:hypothetical protein
MTIRVTAWNRYRSRRTMADTNELAKRLRAAYYGRTHVEDWTIQPEWLAVAQAALDAREDDGSGQPVTEEWLTEIGVRQRHLKWHDWRLYLSTLAPPHLDCPVGRGQWEDSPNLASCPTRGHVRKLLEALDMPLGGRRE